jgi:hypothetical protein
MINTKLRTEEVKEPKKIINISGKSSDNSNQTVRRKLRFFHKITRPMFIEY